MNVTAYRLKQAGFDIQKGPECPYCKPARYAVLIPATKYYNDTAQQGGVWVCRGCNASVGTHKRGKWKNYPLGSLANQELKQVRKRAHILFDNIWQTNRMNRNDAYQWLREKMNKDEPNGHIGEFTIEECHQAIELMDSLLY